MPDVANQSAAERVPSALETAMALPRPQRSSGLSPQRGRHLAAPIYRYVHLRGQSLIAFFPADNAMRHPNLLRR